MPKTATNLPNQDPSGTAFEASPAFLLAALGNRISVAAERNLRRLLNLSLMEWKVLTVLAEEPAAPPGRIIGLTGVNKAAVSRAVNSLEQRGLLRRKPAADHALRTQLYLTSKGKALHDRGTGSRLKAEAALLLGFNARDRNQLTKWLVKLVHNLDSQSAGTPPG